MRNFKIVHKTTGDVYVVLDKAFNKYLVRKVSDNSLLKIDIDTMTEEYLFLEFYVKDGPK